MIKKAVVTAFLSLMFGAPANAAFIPYPTQLSADFVSEVQNIFPEGILVQPKLLDYHVDPNVHLFQDAEVIVTFIDEKAALANSFGYFLYTDKNQDHEIQEEEILKREEIFKNSSKEGDGGTLKPGDTVNLGKFPKGTHLGFYLEGDGFRETLWTFYTIDRLNFDAQRHLAMMVTEDNENIALGIEDLPWERSDKDFNDLLFSFTTEPRSALNEVIEAGNIPRQSELTEQNVEAIPPPDPVVEPQPPAIEPLSLQGGGLRCGVAKGANPLIGQFWIFPMAIYALMLWIWRIDKVATCSYDKSHGNH